MTKLFFDFEFTGLHIETTPISLGIAASNGKRFYAEFTDYNREQVNNWIQTNVIGNLLFNDKEPFFQEIGDYTYIKGDSYWIQKTLNNWLRQFKHVEFWADVIPYDGVLLNELIGTLDQLPKNIDYIFYDIATAFKVFGLDPDISREAFIDRPIKGDKHNSLYDAEVIEACYDKLHRNKRLYPNMI